MPELPISIFTWELLEIRLGVSGVVEHEEKLDTDEQLPFLNS
jgi:hypothetical protein